LYVNQQCKKDLEFVQKKLTLCYFTLLRSKQRRHGCHGSDTLSGK